jgi:Terminase RNaseH-like domain
VDSGRGRKYAVVVVDEAAMIPELEEAWQQSIRPTLTDLQGSAWFLSTPKGMNYFRVLFDRGQDPERADWASWQMPTGANPYLEPGEIEEARLDITESAFNQEYLALFINWEGSVFRRVGEAATAVPKGKPEAGHDYVIGCDWGRSNDYTVFVVLDTTSRAVVAMDRSNRVDYAVQCDRLKALSDQWQPTQIIAEQNSIGQPVIEQLTRDGLRIQPFTTTNASKAQAIESLALAFERGEIRILNDTVLVSELAAYQAERLPSGLTRYAAPSGQHDDTVMALAMSWSAVSGRHRLIYPIRDNEITVKDHPIPDHWPRAYGLDIRGNTAVAIWGARDPESDVLYLYSEYCGEADPAVQAAAIRARGDWIPGVIDPAANGRNPVDGQRLIQLYRKHGLHLQAIDNSLESGILEVCQRMRSGRLKVLASLSKYLEERRLYRRNDRDEVVKDRDNLQDAARCLVVGLSRMCTKPVQSYFPAQDTRRGGDRGWMI